MLRKTAHIQIFTLLLLFSTSVPLFAQRTEILASPERDYRNALELYDKAKYSAAQKVFEAVIDRIDNTNDETQVNAEYYQAVCALELFNRDAEFMLKEFVRRHPESPRVKVARYQLGRYYYRKKKFKDALEWFEKVDEYDLSNSELAEFYFKKGYSYFRTDNLKEASRLFYEIKDTEGDYRDPALYFYSHIAYEEGNYQTALEGFDKLRTHAGFGKVVPFYIAQILYMQHKYDELISYAGPLIDTAKVKREGEIARLIGESYYRTDRFKEAVPFLELYHKKSPNVSRDDRYQMGYAYYRSDQHNEALQQFNRVTDKKDPVSQAAYYHMGDSYLQLERKSNARSAFKEASKMEFDTEVRENSLYNYAKLSYELDYDPFNQAIGSFEAYLNEFPQSDKKEEVYDFLLNVYMKTKAYDKALASLDKINNKDLRLQTTYQIVAFNSGVEHYGRREFKEAIEAFDKVNTYPIDKEITNNAIYWTGETYYSLGEYENAIVQYDKFRAQPGAILHPHFNLANYNKGYAYIKKKQYAQALAPLRSFAAAYNKDDRTLLNEAYLRIGDCFYVDKRINDAIEYYEKAVEIKLVQNDYAYLQQALCYGLLLKYDKKVAVLKKALSEYSNSKLAVELKYELAETYRLQGNSTKAMSSYRSVIDDHPASAKVVLAKSQLGLLLYQSGKKSQGIAMLEDVARNATSYPEAKDALNSLKLIYAAEGTPEKYPDLLNALAYVNLEDAELDTLNYNAAEQHYFNESYDKALTAFDKYLEKFPDGIFFLNARFYRADCYLRQNREAEALADLNHIIGLSNNRFTEDALLWAAELNFKKEDYNAAVGNYLSLENVTSLPERLLIAQIGQLRCFDKLHNCSSAVTYADKVRAHELASDEDKQEAGIIKARCLLDAGQLANARREFEGVADGLRNKYAAEAKYQIAYIWFLETDYDKSDDAIKEYLQKGPAYDHWVAMCFLLLAENSIAQGDYFQAKATLQSLIENHDGAYLVNKAQERLDWIIEQENAQKAAPGGENFDVRMQGVDDGQEDLYREDDLRPRRERRRGNSAVPDSVGNLNGQPNMIEEGGQR